jgi:hypothetical protein
MEPGVRKNRIQKNCMCSIDASLKEMVAVGVSFEMNSTDNIF